MKRQTYKFKTKPHPHQVKALKHLYKTNGGAVWMPMRTGKTKVAIDYCSSRALKHNLTPECRVLIVGKRRFKSVWRMEIKKHCPYLVDWVDLQGNDVDLDNREALNYNPKTTSGQKIVFGFVNYERLWAREKTGKHSWVPGKNQLLYDFMPEMVVVDEGHRIADHMSEMSRKLRRLCDDLGIPDWGRVLLTGTAFQRGRLRVFGMFMFLDKSVFGTSYSAYKRQYTIERSRGNYTEIVKFINQKRWRKKLKRKAFLVRRVPQRPPVHQVIYYDLEESVPAYVKMAAHGFLKVGGATCTAEIPITRELKLAQIASGFIRDDDRRWHRVGFEGRRALTSLLEDLADSEVQKLVLYAWFLPSLRDAGIAAREVGYHLLPFHGKTSDEMMERRIAHFEETDEPSVFLAQVETASEGIPLHAADTAIYYEHPRSLVTWDQSQARIWPPNPKLDTRPRTYYHILGRDTAKALRYLALNSRTGLIRLLERHPELLDYEVKE